MPRQGRHPPPKRLGVLGELLAEELQEVQAAGYRLARAHGIDMRVVVSGNRALERLVVVSGIERVLHLADDVTQVVGWDYPDPFPPYEAVAGWFSFYPARLTCTVDDEVARPQPGGFYGGWVTDDIAGPVKGSPGSQGW